MEEIKKKRKNLGVSQFGLANASGIGRFRISILEMGYAKASNDELTAMKAGLSRLEKEASGPTKNAMGVKHV